MFCVAAAALLLMGALLGAAQMYLNSPRFQQQLIAEVSRQIQCEVKLEKMKIRFWRGIDLVGIRLASDQRRPRDFLKAERLRLRYNLFEALFHQKIVIEELKLSSPSIKLDLSEPFSQMTDRSRPPVTAGDAETPPPIVLADVPFTDESPAVSSSNRDSPPPRSPSPRSPPSSSSGASPSKPIPQPWVAPPAEQRKLEPPSIDLRRLVIEDGSLSLILPDGEKLVLSGAQIKAAFSSNPVPNVVGSVTCPLAELPSHSRGMEISDLKLNFLWRANGLEIPHLSAKLLGGVIEVKNFKADATKTEWPFEMSLTVQDLSMSELMTACEVAHPIFEGNLRAETKFQGSMIEPLQSSGLGQSRILNAKLVNTPALTALAGYLNRPDLRNLPLQKCELDFMLQNGILNIPRLQAISSDIEVQGQGWIKLAEQTQEFRMKAALSPAIAEKFPAETINGLTLRADQYREIPFRTWGSLDKPQTDLMMRFTAMATRFMGGSLFDKAYQGVEQLIPKKDEAQKKDE